jgi:DNA invertase Pin-like site-specific DNA recombinase
MNAKPMKIVAYYRVSTQKQGQSGLGLEAQEAAVAAYAAQHGADVVKGFTEVESGTLAERPQLQGAVKLAKQLKARLVVAKLDRLARNVLFIAQLLESKADFAACDLPEANKLTLHIMAAFAEHEAECISNRTKAALAAAKARGIKLGTHNAKVRRAIDHAKGSKLGLPKIMANRAKAHAEAYEAVKPILLEMRDDHTLQEIANRLNDEHATVTGKRFYPQTVKRLLALLPVVAVAATLQ